MHMRSSAACCSGSYQHNSRTRRLQLLQNVEVADLTMSQRRRARTSWQPRRYIRMPAYCACPKRRCRVAQGCIRVVFQLLNPSEACSQRSSQRTPRQRSICKVQAGQGSRRHWGAGARQALQAPSAMCQLRSSSVSGDKTASAASTAAQSQLSRQPSRQRSAALMPGAADAKQRQSHLAFCIAVRIP